ncbi:MAG: hypothetical protein U0905_22150 [Pirellulales bacterium]
MSFRLFLLAIVLLSSLSMAGAKAQESLESGEPIEFNTILDRIYEERMKPLSFEVHVKHLIRSRMESENAPPIFIITELKSEVVFDEVPGYLFVKQTAHFDLANLGSIQDGQSIEKSLEGRYPTYTRVVSDRGHFYISNGEYGQKSRVEKLRKLLPFPWENLGLVMPIDLNDPRTELQNSISAMKKYLGQWKVTPDKDGVVTIDLKSRIHRIDTKRGYWPTAFLSESSRDIKGKEVRGMDRGTSIVLDKVGKHWLPTRVELNLNSSSESYTFDWKSFDSAIDEKRFDVDTIMEREKAVKQPQGIEALLRMHAK